MKREHAPKGVKAMVAAAEAAGSGAAMGAGRTGEWQAAGSSTASSPMRVAILTAFTVDYEIGAICAAVNREYAARHGYAFVCREYPPSTADDARHPTWNKVELLNEALQCLHGGATAPSIVPSDTTHLLWIDADAVVARHDARLEELWSRLPDSIELLIGEDVTPACLVNAGVLGVRVSAWSAALWSDVWSAASSDKYHQRRYHEQSALLRQLQDRGEGLQLVQAPWHSYVGGGYTPRLFPHVCVLPRRSLNTNRYDLSGAREDPHYACDYIFHAAGHPILQRRGPGGNLELWKPPKKEAIRAVLAHAYGGGDADLPAAAGIERAKASACQCPPSTHARFPGRIMN